MKESRSGITNIIGKGTSINGKVKVQGSIHVDGVIDGNVDVSESLIIGKSGKVEGEIHAKDCLVGGKVKGNIISDEKVEFQSGASLKGDIKCKRLVIEEGVLFDGNCIMSDKTNTSTEKKSTRMGTLLPSPLQKSLRQDSAKQSQDETKQVGASNSS